MDEAGALEWLALTPPSLEDWPPPVHAWLERTETIGAAYQAWEELRSEYAKATQSHAQKSAYLTMHGEFILGAAQKMHAQEALGENAAAPVGLLASPGGQLIEQSRQRLSEISQMWASAQLHMRRCFEQASREIEQEIVRRVDKTLAAVRPKLSLAVHHLGKERCILQCERISELDSILLSRLISGKVPTHYAFLFDDSVSQVEVAEALYADETTEQPPWPRIRELLGDKEKLSAPWKGQIPIVHEEELVWMLKQKGVVMEVEQAAMEEAQASPVLEVSKAQWIVAHFLRWMHEGKMDLRLQP